MIKLAAIVFALCAAPAWSATYYISTSGSDSNNGTSTSTPWLHAPGMTGCSGNCASTTPSPGDSFIFRGGDTWYGNGGGSPTGLPWEWGWGGTSGSRIYLGVDQSWFTGGAWHRPVFSTGNATSTSTVGSCAHNDSNFTYVSINSVNYVTLDNFEFTGLCWNTTPGFFAGTYLGFTNASNVASGANLTISHNYFHGWTHTACGSGCDTMVMTGITYGNQGQGNQIIQNVIDGSDTDGKSMYALYGDCYDFHENVVRFTANGPVCNNMHTFHDNLFEHTAESFANPGMHSNTFEFNGEWDSNNFVYNNLIRHNFDAGSSGEVNVWVTPNAGRTDYYFGNVVFDIGGDGSGNYWDVEEGGNAFFYNNTFEMGAGRVRFQGSTAHATFVNNHFVNSGATTLSGIADNSNGSTVSGNNNVFETTAQATTDGATSSNNYLPASGAVTTSGTNLTSSCGVNAALCSDTTLGVSYDATNHAVTGLARSVVSRPTSSSWDASAYQISGGGGSPTAPTITSTSPLPAGTASSAYSQTLAASGTPPITWGITSGALPTGLSLGSSSGTISGTATTPGTSTITVQATNSVGNASKTLSLTVNAALPVINSFSASPSSINAGTSSTLSWATTGATVVAIDNGIGTVTGTSKSVTPTSTTAYKLTATNAGGSVSAIATVTVTIGGGLGTPPAIAGFTDADLLVAADHCDTTLSADITDTALSLSVASLSTCVPNQVLFIDSEQLKNCSGASNVFTICSGGRGFAGTAAATHKQGARVRGRIGAVYHNQAARADIALANLIAGQTHHGTYPGGTSIGGACWPNHICSIAELYTASDFADSTLSAGIGATDTSLTVADGSFYQSSQVVQVGQEFIKVGTASGTTLSGLTRGIGGTAAAQHATGSSVVGVIAAFEFERLKLELHAMESDLYGTAGSTQSSVCGTSCPVVPGVSWPNHVFGASEAGTAINGGPFPALWRNRLKDEVKAFAADLSAHP